MLLDSELSKGNPFEIYTTVEKIGCGAYGDIYRGYKIATGDAVAVKVLRLKDEEKYHENQISLIVNEIRALKAMDCDNTIHLLDAYRVDNLIWIVTDYVSGLHCLDISAANIMYLADIAGICRGVLRALVSLHDKGIIHYDVKEENVMVSHSGEVKLLDYGLVAMYDDDHVGARGTRHYMAPEVLYGMPRDFSLDIWSFGVMVFVLVEGICPFEGKTLREVYEQIRVNHHTVAERLSNKPKQLQEFIAQCLQRSPKRRPTARQLLDHPFLENAAPSARLSDVVEQAMDISFMATGTYQV